MATLLPDMAERYWQLLIDGDADALLALFTGAPRIDAVHPGTVEGEDAVRAFAAGTHDWLTGMRAHLSPVRTTRGDFRSIAEQELHLHLDDGRDVHLPTAVVAERAEAPRLERVSVYHSMWPLNGRHDVRRPFLEVDPDLQPPDVVGRYEEALAQGNLRAIMDLFEPDAYVREPAGAPFVHRGEEHVRDFFLTSFGNVGGVVHDLCTVTDDGEACVVEYNAMKWGQTVLQPQPGIMVCERGTDGMLLHAVRIYEDVATPMESQPSASSVQAGTAPGR
jgi:hypothetical protein